LRQGWPRGRVDARCAGRDPATPSMPAKQQPMRGDSDGYYREQRAFFTTLI